MKDTIIGVVVIIILACLLVVLSGFKMSSQCSRTEEIYYENIEHDHDL